MASSSHHPGYHITMSDNGSVIRVCFDERIYNASTWTMTAALPILFLQISIILALSAFFFILMKPLHQPRLVAQISAGLLLGPSCLGYFDNVQAFSSTVLPFTSMTVLHLVTNVGIIYYMFLVGLEMSITPILRIRRKAMTIAIVGILLSLAAGFGSFLFLFPIERTGKSLVLAKLKSALPWAIVLSSTSFTDLTRTLSDMKLLRTDLGRTALSCALISDIGTWLFLFILIAVANQHHFHIIFAGVVFILSCIFVVRHILAFLISCTATEDEDYEAHIPFILCGVLVFAFTSDLLGLTPVVGAFLFGFILPNGQLEKQVRGSLEMITNWISIPLYFLIIGLKTNVHEMVPNDRTRIDVATFILLGWAAKFVSTTLVSLLYRMKPRDAFSLGLLMNTKGILAIVVTNLSNDLLILNVTPSSSMIVTIMLMMFSVPLTIRLAYKQQTRQEHQLRTIQSLGPDTTFRMVACLHYVRNAPAITKLLKVSNPTEQSPIHIVVVQLVELTDHTSANMLIVHDVEGSMNGAGGTMAEDWDKIIREFEEYSQLNEPVVSIELLTALSPYQTMHVDICNIAEDKEAAIVILPFEPQDKTCSDEQGTDSSRNIVQSLLSQPPCTVGLLVSRGLGTFDRQDHRFIMFFIGGPDDREALAYAWRMAWKTREVNLTVLRFIQGQDATGATGSTNMETEESIANDVERQKYVDEAFLDEFKYRNMSNRSIRYLEEVSSSGEETLTIIRETIEQGSYELCIVGRSNCSRSPLLSGLSGLVEFTELGLITDALITSDFIDDSSILVIQHYGNSKIYTDE